MLLEPWGSSEMKGWGQQYLWVCVPWPRQHLKTFHPLQFVIHTVCVPIRNNLSCCWPEPHGPISSLYTSLRAILPKSAILLPLPADVFPQTFSETLTKRKPKVLFQYLMLDSWPLVFHSLALAHTSPASSTTQTCYSTTLLTMRSQCVVISFCVILSCQ